MRSACNSALGCLVLALATAACGGDEAMPDPDFPADYARTYTEVRDCRASTEHDFANIRVLADPLAEAPYRDRTTPFPEGAILLKEEHDMADEACTGDVLSWAVVTRLAPGSSPETLDWRWQKVGAGRRVLSEDEPRCVSCHTDCGVPPDGYGGTCAVP